MRKAPFLVFCSDPQHKNAPAKYKIAAEWIGGGYRELKTFGFADDECIENVYLEAAKRAAKIRPSSGEELGPLQVFLLEPKRHDYQLTRVPELERRLHLLAETRLSSSPELET